MMLVHSSLYSHCTCIWRICSVDRINIVFSFERDAPDTLKACRVSSLLNTGNLLVFTIYRPPPSDVVTMLSPHFIRMAQSYNLFAFQANMRKLETSNCNVVMRVQREYVRLICVFIINMCVYH